MCRDRLRNCIFAHPGDGRTFIQKPFLLEELARRVRQSLDPPSSRAA